MARFMCIVFPFFQNVQKKLLPKLSLDTRTFYRVRLTSLHQMHQIYTKRISVTKQTSDTLIYIYYSFNLIISYH